jgi:hypothetical protein
MPRLIPLITFNERLIVSAACVSNQPGSLPAPNIIIVSITFEDGTPITGLTAKDFLVVTYNIENGRPNTVNLRQVIELKDELTGIDFKGIYKVEPESEEVFKQIHVGQTVYAIKVSKTSVSNPFTQYFGQTVVSVVMQNSQ